MRQEKVELIMVGKGREVCHILKLGITRPSPHWVVYAYHVYKPFEPLGPPATIAQYGYMGL